MKLDKITVLKITGILTFCILLFCALQNMNAVKSGASTLFSYLAPFVTGGAIAFIINVPMRYVERHLFPKAKKLDKFRRPLALILTLLIILSILTAVGIIVIPQLVETISSLAVYIPEYMEKVQKYLEQLLADYPDLQSQIASFNINWQSIITSVTGWISSGLSSTISIAGNAINGIVSAVVGFVFAMYVLLQKETLGRHFRMTAYAILPEKAADTFFYISGLASKTFSNFLSGQCLEACILGLMFAAVMAILRMPYIALISVLIAFTALIPLVGAFIGCFIGAFLILTQNPMQALWFVIMFLILQQIEGNLIYPKVVGNSVGLPAIWVLAVVTVGGKLMGISGMLIMIPLSSVIYTLFREYVYKKLHNKNVRIQKMFFRSVTSAPKETKPVDIVAENSIQPAVSAQTPTKNNNQSKKRGKRR